MVDMKKWEYVVVGMSIANNGSTLIWNGPEGMQEYKYRGLAPREYVGLLNQAGEAGWEAVGYTMAFGIASGVSCLLKRPLE
jgi:hypothetical protein